MGTISESGSVSINGKKYNYKFFDSEGLTSLIKNNKKFINALEKAFIDYHGSDSKFKIKDLTVKPVFSTSEKIITMYYVLYLKDVVVSIIQFYYLPDSKIVSFILVYTNSEFRGQKICQKNIERIISVTKEKIKEYELYVEINNSAAIKCYENIGFKKTGKEGEYHLMTLNQS